MESMTRERCAVVDQRYPVRHRLDGIHTWDTDASAMVFLVAFLSLVWVLFAITGR